MLILYSHGSKTGCAFPDNIMGEIIVVQRLDISHSSRTIANFGDYHKTALHVVLVSQGRFTTKSRGVILATFFCRFADELAQNGAFHFAAFVVSRVKDGVVNEEMGGGLGY